MEIHFDNAALHSAKQTRNWVKSRGLRVMDRPLYSPDLAPSDFGLFGTLKEKPRAYETEEPEALEQTTPQLLSEFDKDFFQSLFAA